MIVVLTVLSGAQEGRKLKIEPGQMGIFGRASTAQFPFEDDNHMSSLHMEIENNGTAAIIRDRRSTNRTWVNNKETLQAQLKTGDQVRAGKTRFEVLLQDDDATPPAPSGSAPVRQPEPRPHVPPIQAPSPIQSSSEEIRAGDSRSVVNRSTSPTNGNGTGNYSPSGGVIESSIIQVPKPSPIQIARLDQGVNRRASASSDGPIAESSFTRIPNLETLLEGLRGERFVVMAQEEGGCDNDSIRAGLNNLRRSRQVRVIAHFQKLGLPTPVGTSAATPLFPRAMQAGQFLPVILTWAAWESKVVSELTPRLLGSDALMIVIGSEDCEIDNEILQVGRDGLQGFASPSGFLNWCWPSSFVGLIALNGIPPIEALFSQNIRAILFPDPTYPTRLVALLEHSMRDVIEEFSLRPLA